MTLAPLLSPRQLEIARLVADDLTDKEIAHILQISIHTVQAHLDRIGAKLATAQSKHSRRRVIARWLREYESPPSDASHAA